MDEIRKDFALIDLDDITIECLHEIHDSLCDDGKSHGCPEWECENCIALFPENSYLDCPCEGDAPPEIQIERIRELFDVHGIEYDV